MSRIVRLLDPPELTPRQKAQRKYQQSHKGKAAARRHYRLKRAPCPVYRAEASARASAWQKANPMKRRVYKRIWQQTQKRLAAPQRTG